MAAPQYVEYMVTDGLMENYQFAYRQFHSSETTLVWVQIIYRPKINRSISILILDWSAAFTKLLQHLSTRFGAKIKALVSRMVSYLSSRT